MEVKDLLLAHRVYEIEYDMSDNADSISCQHDMLFCLRDMPSKMALVEILVVNEGLYNFKAKLGGYAEMNPEKHAYTDGYSLNEGIKLNKQEYLPEPKHWVNRIILLNYNQYTGDYTIEVKKDGRSKMYETFVDKYNEEVRKAIKKEDELKNVKEARLALAKLTKEELNTLLAEMLLQK